MWLGRKDPFVLCTKGIVDVINAGPHLSLKFVKRLHVGLIYVVLGLHETNWLEVPLKAFVEVVALAVNFD